MFTDEGSGVAVVWAWYQVLCHCLAYINLLQIAKSSLALWCKKFNESLLLNTCQPLCFGRIFITFLRWNPAVAELSKIAHLLSRDGFFQAQNVPKHVHPGPCWMLPKTHSAGDWGETSFQFPSPLGTLDLSQQGGILSHFEKLACLLLCRAG